MHTLSVVLARDEVRATVVNIYYGGEETSVGKLQPYAVQSVSPVTYVLHQNYPNPFNPSTTIKYDLPTDARVDLTVYDVLGREILTLVDGFQEAGYHQVTLDARNLASGIYFYRLTAGSFTDVKKLIVMK